MYFDSLESADPGVLSSMKLQNLKDEILEIEEFEAMDGEIYDSVEFLYSADIKYASIGNAWFIVPEDGEIEIIPSFCSFEKTEDGDSFIYTVNSDVFEEERKLSSRNASVYLAQILKIYERDNSEPGLSTKLFMYPCSELKFFRDKNYIYVYSDSKFLEPSKHFSKGKGIKIPL